MADVFLSYAREDRDLVRPIQAGLQNSGLQVFWDTEIEPGHRWDEALQERLEQAKCVVVAWSKSSVRSQWVKDEAGYGRDHNVLLPVSLDGTPPPLGFRQIQTVDLSLWSGGDTDPALREVVRRAERLLGIEPAAPPRPEPISAVADIASTPGAWSTGMSQVRTFLEKVLALGTSPEMPLELYVPYRVANLLLLIMIVQSAIWAALAATLFYVPLVAVVNLLNMLGYSLALLFVALGFADAGRLLGVAVGLASFCFFVAVVRPNLIGVEFFLVGLLAVPLVVFARSERGKLLVCFSAIVLCSVIAFYISYTTEGLLHVNAYLATVAYYLILGSLAAIIAFAIWYFNFGYVENFVELEKARDKTATLLARTLPQLIVDRLDKGEQVIGDSHAEAVVLFADLVGFTDLMSKLAPRHALELLNRLFSRFDEIAETHGVEKIKTIGDCYMAVGGLFTESTSDAADVAELALEMRDVAQQLGRSTGYPIDLRIGIASGQVISGVIGRNRMAFDIWGQTVNLASRMESTGEVGSIQVSESTYWRLRDRYDFDEADGLGLEDGTVIMSYLLTGRNDDAVSSIRQ